MFLLPMLTCNMAVTIDAITQKAAAGIILEYDMVSIISRDDICLLINNKLGTNFIVNQLPVIFEPGDLLLIAHYVGPRLENGSTEFPPRAKIKWYLADFFKRYL